MTFFESQRVSIHTPTQGVTQGTVPYDREIKVSIHTPTQGVTAMEARAEPTSEVSIHTPTQGVTSARNDDSTAITRFNPHTHAGCDYFFWFLVLSVHVSIHTPTQGVTSCCTSPKHVQQSFNPHTHAGCDSVQLNISSDGKFQSTHPRRV